MSLTSPADTKELVPIVSFPYDPASDTTRVDYDSENIDIHHGFNLTSHDAKSVAKIIIRHPDDPSLILFGLRRDDQAWCTPGGHVDLGESPMDAMFREFFEECGMELSSCEHALTVQSRERPVIVHLFEGHGPSPDIWEQLSNEEDPDSEFICYQYLNPLDTDFPLHIPYFSNALVYYLSSPEHKTAFENSLMDLTTEKEACKKIAILRKKKNENTGKTEWALLGKKPPHRVLKWFGTQKPSEERVNKEESRIQYFKHKGFNQPDLLVQNVAPPTYRPKGPDLIFKRTDEALNQAYTDENMWEDADMHLEGQIDEGDWVTMSGTPVLLDKGEVKSGPAKGVKLPNAEHKPLDQLKKEKSQDSGKLSDPKKVEGPGGVIHEKDKDAAIDNLAGSIKSKDWDKFMDHMDAAFEDAKIGEIDSTEAAQIGRSHNLTFSSDPDNEMLHQYNKNKRGKEVKDPAIIIEFDGKHYALDGQHRLNIAIKDKKPVNVAILKGDFLKKFGITEKTFEGKKTWDKESSVPAYSQGGMSPADEMQESLGEIFIQQHASVDEEYKMADIQLSINPAISTETSKGLTVEMENKRDGLSFELMKDRSIRTPARTPNAK